MITTVKYKSRTYYTHDNFMELYLQTKHTTNLTFDRSETDTQTDIRTGAPTDIQSVLKNIGTFFRAGLHNNRPG